MWSFSKVKIANSGGTYLKDVDAIRIICCVPCLLPLASIKRKMFILHENKRHCKVSVYIYAVPLQYYNAYINGEIFCSKELVRADIQLDLSQLQAQLCYRLDETTWFGYHQRHRLLRKRGFQCCTPFFLRTA